MHRILLFALLFTSGAWATEVASISACKPEGEIWICATWKDNRVAVYRSQHYLSGIEFTGEVGSVTQSASKATTLSTTMSATTMSATKRMSKSAVASDIQGEALAGRYTLQLLACHSAPCNRRLQRLKSIPESREVEIKNANALWRVLLVGRYNSIKTAQQAAAELMSEYKLRDKPWVRTLDSIARRRVGS
ncbi:MAG: septal ring-binding cell division protein DamX [Motiliproteus sp.]|jgi:septal ring-binding cell division protein DamX